MRLADPYVRKSIKPILELRESLGLSNRVNPADIRPIFSVRNASIVLPSVGEAATGLASENNADGVRVL